jgi:O-antigen/teichoic acid export membrane protein
MTEREAVMRAGTVDVPLSLRDRLIGRFASDTMLRNSVAIMATSVVTSLFGYVFWLVVARSSTAQVTGAGSAATSALQAAALFAAVGAAAAMIEWLPRSRSELEWRQRLTGGLVVAATAGVVGGVLVVVVLGHVVGTLPALRSPVGGVLFCLGTVFFAVGAVYDYAAVAERSGVMMLARNALFTAARIPLLLVPWLLPGTTDQILTSWTTAAGLSLLIGLVGFRRSTHGRSLAPTTRGLPAVLREMRKSLLGQHFITIAAMMGTYLLPIIVAVRISPAANAYFYATWMLGGVFFMISPAVSASLFAASASDPGAVAAAARRSAAIIAALLVVPMIVYLLGGGVLLSLFGRAYPHEGRLLLVLLTLSAVPDAVTNIAVAVLRATNRLRGALSLNTTMLVTSLVLSWLLLPRLGIVAVGVAWIVAQTAGAVWVAVSWRRITESPITTGAAA